MSDMQVETILKLSAVAGGAWSPGYQQPRGVCQKVVTGFAQGSAICKTSRGRAHLQSERVGSANVIITVITDEEIGSARLNDWSRSHSWSGQEPRTHAESCRATGTQKVFNKGF